MDFAPETLIADKYRLVRPLAEGGMGAIWVGYHMDLDVKVAIKLMGEDVSNTTMGRQRFRQEARAAARLKSPHVTQIHDYGVFEGKPYMVMELLEGEDLASHLDRHTQLPLARVVEIIEPVCRGLELAHAAGIVHRDLKPSNIFLSKSGEHEVVKILDFGIAKLTAPERAVEGTVSGALVGSPRYMSPEQAQGIAVDRRSDIWSLGVTTYEMLAGYPPFSGANLGQVITAIMNHQVTSLTKLADVPDDIDDFFEVVLHRDVAVRLDSASLFARALRAIAEGEPLTVKRDVPSVGLHASWHDVTPRSEATVDGDPLVAHAQTAAFPQAVEPTASMAPDAVEARAERVGVAGGSPSSRGAASVGPTSEGAARGGALTAATRSDAGAGEQRPRVDATTPGLGVDTVDRPRPGGRRLALAALIGAAGLGAWALLARGPGALPSEGATVETSSELSSAEDTPPSSPSGASPSASSSSASLPSASRPSASSPSASLPGASSPSASSPPVASSPAVAMPRPNVPVPRPSAAPPVTPAEPKTDEVFGIPKRKPVTGP